MAGRGGFSGAEFLDNGFGQSALVFGQEGIFTQGIFDRAAKSKTGVVKLVGGPFVFEADDFRGSAVVGLSESMKT